MKTQETYSTYLYIRPGVEIDGRKWHSDKQPGTSCSCRSRPKQMEKGEFPLCARMMEGNVLEETFDSLIESLAHHGPVLARIKVNLLSCDPSVRFNAYSCLFLRSTRTNVGSYTRTYMYRHEYSLSEQLENNSTSF